MRCSCGHLRLSHHYSALIGDNTGTCLALNCDCPIYEEDE